MPQNSTWQWDLASISEMKIFSAPIQGYTDCAWRNAHSRIFAGDIDRYYAPFLRLEKGAFRNKDLRDIAPESNRDYHLVPQVIACERSQFAMLVDKVVSLGYREVDINMGCPFPPIVKRHCGAGMLPFPDEVRSMLGVTEEYPDVNFSVKMRLGVNSPDEWLALMPILSATKLSHVTLHPRTARQQYTGDIDMAAFARFMTEATFPVVYNGEIHSVADFDALTAEYPALHAVMIGRGLLYDPALASPEHDSALPCIIKLHDRLFDSYKAHLSGDAHLLAKMKSLWEYFLAGKGSRKCRKRIKKSTTIDKYIAAVNDFWDSYDNSDTPEE